MSNTRRTVAFTLVVLLSLAFPVGVAVWSVYSFLTSAVLPFEIAILKDNEIWFTENHAAPGVSWPPLPEYQSKVKCFKLSTGIERSLGIDLKDGLTPHLCVGNGIYLVSQTAVYHWTDDTFDKSGATVVKFDALMPSGAGCVMNQSAFLYDGELTTVVDDDAGNGWLRHFRAGRWVNGRKLCLPPQGFVCKHFNSDARNVFIPEYFKEGSVVEDLLPAAADSTAAIDSVSTDAMNTNGSYSPVAYSPSTVVTTVGLGPGKKMWSLQVQQIEGHSHVLYWRADGFCAYRNELDFEDSKEDVASALAPENFIQDANGWEPVPTAGAYIHQMVCDRDGPLLSLWSGALIRRNSNAVWSAIIRAENPEPDSMPRFIVDSENSDLYIVADGGQVLHVKGLTFQPSTLTVPDYQRAYLARWAWLLFGMACAWLLHVILVTVGTDLLNGNQQGSEYEFGVQSVVLASIWRRGLALSIDLAIFAVALTLSMAAHWWFAGLSRSSTFRRDLVNSLMTLESSLDYEGWEILTTCGDAIVELSKLIVLSQQEELWAPTCALLMTVLIDTGLVLWLLKDYQEGRYGVTPGKWLLGVRTMRTTLRNCGFARAIFRDALSWIDLPGFMTPLPAAASILYSSNRQRWGDRVADTIVVDAKSLRRNSTCGTSRTDATNR